MLTLIRQSVPRRKPLDPRIKAILVERGERKMGSALIGSIQPAIDLSTVKRVQMGSSQWVHLTLNGWMMTSIEADGAGDIAVMEKQS